ncbi:MAG: TPM domain-containing protein [Vicinamibacteria bacterium]
MKVPRRLREDVTEENLDAIAAAVDEVESRTSGEVMVHIVHNLLPLEKPRARALRAFFQLGVNQTRERNGVLLFVAMKKRGFEIVADEAIHAKVGERIWSEISAVIAEAIDHDGFEAGICLGVSLIGDVLSQHFPRPEEDVNELPNRPIMPIMESE